MRVRIARPVPMERAAKPAQILESGHHPDGSVLHSNGGGVSGEHTRDVELVDDGACVLDAQDSRAGSHRTREFDAGIGDPGHDIRARQRSGLSAGSYMEGTNHSPPDVV